MPVEGYAYKYAYTGRLLKVKRGESKTFNISYLKKNPITFNCYRMLIVIQVTFFNRLIINCLYKRMAYNMPTFLIYYRLFLT